MAIDFELLNKVLGNSKSKYRNNNKASNSTSFWKPQPGVQVVRIVPYKYNPTNIPFMHYKFYFFMMPEIKRPFLSPSFYGHPDPIKEAQNVLFSTGDLADREIAKKMFDTDRFYIAVIVRGREHDGIKLWGTSWSVASKIKNIITGQWGDITDLNNGYDLTVECFPKGTRGMYPTTEVTANLKSTVAFDPNDSIMQNLFQNPPNITEIFKEPTYDELKEAVTKWLHPDAANESFQNPSKNTFSTVNESAVKNPFLNTQPMKPTPQLTTAQPISPAPAAGFMFNPTGAGPQQLSTTATQQVQYPKTFTAPNTTTSNPFLQPTSNQDAAQMFTQPTTFSQTSQPVQQPTQNTEVKQNNPTLTNIPDDINNQLKEMFGIQ